MRLNPGVGSTLGLGLYVLAGQVASNKAGPGVVVSFGLAALASAFSALCYAEFAGRVPRAGSAYAYSYITVGEFVAFVIGWNLILEYVIGAASVARGFSGYLRFVVERLIEGPTGLDTSQPIVANSSSLIQLPVTIEQQPDTITAILEYLERYFDWPSIVIIFVITIFILFGVKESTNVNLVFTLTNLLVVTVVVISSLRFLNFQNWFLAKSQVPTGFGEGGFLPYGWSGVLAGSATCFFGFIGFDTIASSAEEAKNPKRNVPLSIILSLSISTLAYMAIAIVQTLLWPYYDQNKVTILPYIFERLHMPLTYWIVLVGAIAGLASSQLGGMYPLPRILYSMAADRLIYGFMSKVNSRIKLPLRATLVGSLFIAILSCLLDIEDLADMVSIGTLAAYSLVSLSVLILRYETRQDTIDDSTIISNRLSFADLNNAMELSRQSETKDSESWKRPASDNNNNNKSSVGTKSKLCSKASTPIREKGSRALTAQMSVGFNSWFKSQQVSNNQVLEESAKKSAEEESRGKKLLDLLIGWRSDEHRSPSDQSSGQSKLLIGLIVLLSLLVDLLALALIRCLQSPESQLGQTTGKVHLWSLLSGSCVIVSAVLGALMLMLSRLPSSDSGGSDMFRVPLVPLVPCLSILVNTFLMLNLSYLTWVRFTVWMTLGLIIYFSYGIWNSQGYLVDLDR